MILFYSHVICLGTKIHAERAAHGQSFTVT